MSYAPASDNWSSLISIGSFMDDTWPTCFAEHENVYLTFNSLAASGMGVMPATAADTSKTANSRFVVFRNTDNVRLMVRLRATATTADCVLTLDYGSASATTTIPAGSTVTREISVVPTSSMAGGTIYREAVLSHTCGTGGTIKIHNLTGYLVPESSIGAAGGLIHGKSSSGFIRCPEGSELLNQTNDHSISTERVERALSGPIYIAKDRPQCIGSLIRHTEDRELGTSKKTEWVTVARGFLSVLAHEPIDIRAFYHLNSTTGGDPESRFCWLGDTATAITQTGTGWKQSTLTEVLANNSTPAAPELSLAPWAIQARVESSGSGLVYVDSCQVYREPRL